MSFANYDLEAQRRVPQNHGLFSKPHNSGSGSADLDSIIKNTSHQIQTYGLLVASFNNERRLLGSRRDGIQYREKLTASQQNIVSLGSAIRRLLADINTVMSDSAANNHELAVSDRQHMMKDRLTSEFSDLVANYEWFVQNHREKVASTPLPKGMDESSPLLSEDSKSRNQQQQQQLQVQEDQDTIEQTELQYHMMLTEERNRQIEQVAEGIREVNSIFKDLGELVNQQGEQLDTVEENVLQMSGNAHEASRELTKAHEYQKKRSKWSCILLVALVVFVLVMVLAIMS